MIYVRRAIVRSIFIYLVIDVKVSAQCSLKWWLDRIIYLSFKLLFQLYLCFSGIFGHSFLNQLAPKILPSDTLTTPATTVAAPKQSDANSKPLVFDVPFVPDKVNGIFQESTGSLNYTALRNLVNKLRFKHVQNWMNSSLSNINKMIIIRPLIH